MALLISEGFDLYGYVNSENWILDSRWTREEAYHSVVVNITAGRRSSPCLQIVYNAAGGYLGRAFCNLQAEYSTLIWGAAVQITPANQTPPTMYGPIQFCNAASSAQVTVNRTAAYAIQIRTGGVAGSVIATSADNVLIPGTYQYIEIKLVCHASTGSVIVKVDGTEVINQSNVNTQGAGSGSYGILSLSNFHNTAGGSNTYYEDLYVCDNAGGSFNDFLGDQKIEDHLFTADGSDAGWTSDGANHYGEIDDLGNGYNTHYVQSDAVGERDSYTITPADMDTVEFVTIRAYCQNPGGGTAKFKPYVLIGGTRYYGDEVQLPAGTCDLREYTWFQNPATATAWTKTALGSANCQFGWETTVIS